MQRLFLGIVLHNHQPVGNYGFVIEHLYEQAYEPMLAALERHPNVSAALHNSGPLIDWMLENRPAYLDRLRALCARGQVEAVTGGYYEPVLPMIPDADKAGQIARMTSFIEQRFGQHPRGLWLTERVWEPGLPGPLADAGVEWTLVDDAHFRMAGMADEELNGYFITEDQGKRIKLFAGSQRLRYTIPWLNVDDLIAELRGIAERSQQPAPYIVLGDDGEKFGGWPTTYAHVWEQGWMERFFAALEAQSEWLELITPGEYAQRFEARGLTYLPSASYAEMMEWAMPPAPAVAYHGVVTQLDQERRDDILRFVRGGFWRYFLAKYSESNAMHKRGIRIDEKLAQRDDPDAREALWQAQCNCPYWHGVFGGVYLRHVRAATNSNLVRAERLADRATPPADVSVRHDDVDFDGRPELLLQTPELSLLVHPAIGGMISELDFRARDTALLDVLTRRRESYHSALLEGTAGAANGDLTNIHGGVRLKHEGLADQLVFDRHRRTGLQDWLLDFNASLYDFSRNTARTFVEPSGEWQHDVTAVEGGSVVRLTREHDGWRMVKQIAIPARGEHIAVSCDYTNASPNGRAARILNEWNIATPQAPGGDDRVNRIEHDGEHIDLTKGADTFDARSFVVRGSAPFGVACDIETPECEVWHFPVESISSSEGGLERVYQGASISITRRIELAPDETASMRFVWRAIDVAPAMDDA